MPNWVRGVLKVDGKDADKVLKKYIHKNKYGDTVFDFNLIKKMPEDLLIISGTTTDDCFAVYLSTLPKPEKFSVLKTFYEACRVPEFFKEDRYLKSQSEIKKIIDDCLKSHREPQEDDPMFPVFKTKQDVINYGKRVYDNIINYGAKDWYDWCVENWGTKWNACETIYEQDTPNKVQFDTAWSDVRELIKELSAKHPENTFSYKYAEEQLGYYTGSCTCQNGEIISQRVNDNYSKEAYEQSFELWGGEEFYRYNEKTGTYEDIEDDGDAEL